MAEYGSVFTVAATSNSGLPVTLTVDAASASVCTISNGTVMIIATSGTCTIDANQAGNESYNAATQVKSSTVVHAISPPAQITFVVQPSNTMAGAAINPPVVVQVLDGGGNPVRWAQVTLAIQSGGATLYGITTGTTDASGQATFTGLSIRIAGTYQLTAAAGALSTISASFVISAIQTKTLIVASAGNGQSAVVSTAYAAPLQAVVTDDFGNPVAGASVTFAMPGSGASVIFAGSATVTTSAAGIATSPAMTANGTTGALLVSATTSNAPSPANFSLKNLTTPANTLTFTQ